MFGTQVIFGVNGQKYSFNSLYVKTVEQSYNIVPLPGAPRCIVGVTELRGEWIPVCDLDIKFNTGASAKTNREIIFVSSSDGDIGCLVDAVYEIGAVADDVQVQLPFIIQSDDTGYVEGIVRHNGELITAIRHESILTRNEAAQLSVAMKSLRKKQEEEAAEQARLEAARKAAEEAARKAAEGAGE